MRGIENLEEKSFGSDTAEKLREVLERMISENKKLANRVTEIERTLKIRELEAYLLRCNSAEEGLRILEQIRTLRV